MKELFDSPFARSAALVHGETRATVRVFLQPLSLQTPEGPEITPAGGVDTRRYLAIAEPAAAARGDTLETERARYRVLRSERFGGHEEWLLCVEAGDGDA